VSYLHPRAKVITASHQRPSAVGATRTRYVGLGSQTDGDYGLFDVLLPAGAPGPGLHYHEHFSESFYVLEGRIEIITDDESAVVGAGELAYVPRRGIHGFRNGSSDSDTRMLILFTPGAPREEYFDGLAALHADGRIPTIEEIDEHALRHDQINIRE
jgi:mannose-6-phosphate isomerase-like protein (cupin superfamily)